MMRRRFVPLLLTALLTAAAIAYFYESGRKIRDDRWLSLILVVAWCFISLQMLLFPPPKWRLLNLALLVTVIGLAAFFGSFVGPLWGWYETPAIIHATYRGCFLVSAPMLIAHSVRLIYRNRPAWLLRRRNDRAHEGPS
jgi:hypothetical protein